MVICKVCGYLYHWTIWRYGYAHEGFPISYALNCFSVTKKAFSDFFCYSVFMIFQGGTHPSHSLELYVVLWLCQWCTFWKSA